MGGERDSLGYIKRLVPQRPKVDEFKALDNDKKILRLTARFNTKVPEDVDRRFIISFYLSDDTISIYEPLQKNSGIVHGKFLERAQYKNVDDLPNIITPTQMPLGGDVKTRKELGLKSNGKGEEDATAAPPLTQKGHSVTLVYVARNGDDVFSEAAIRRMREIEDKITKDPEFPKFCLRADKTGSRSCTAPLSATRLFYAANLNVAETVKKVDALDGSADGELTIFKMENLTTILQELQREVAIQTKMQANAHNASIEGQSLNSSQLSAAIDPKALVVKVASKTGAPLSAVVRGADLFQQLLPIMGALGGSLPVQEEMQDHRAVLQLAAAMKEEIFFKSLVDFLL